MNNNDIYFPKGAQDTSRRITGYAILFNSMSVLLGDFYEVLEPGSVTKELLDKCDIKLTMFHDRTQILARSNRGKGTLQYEVDSKGVKFWAIMPETELGNYALEAVKRGDISGCSFAFNYTEDDKHEYYTSYNSYPLRHVTKIDYISDFTLAGSPAYPETIVENREGVSSVKRTFYTKSVPYTGEAEQKVRELKKRISVLETKALASGKKNSFELKVARKELEQAERALKEQTMSKADRVQALKDESNSILK